MSRQKTYSTPKVLLAVGILIAIMTAAMIFTYLGERVTMNPAGTVGNTAGNLNNGGLFCEYNGKVYFSNAYDGGSLYAMDPSEENIRRISTSQVRNILAGGKYLYYFRLGESGDAGLGSLRTPRTFNRSDLDGKHAVSLVRDVIVTGQLVDNYLYLLSAGDDNPSFYKLKIDKSHRVDLADYIINPACAVNGSLYYNGTQRNHYLYALNTADDSSSVVWEGNLWYPIVEGDYVYYMDVANSYRLCRYSFSQNVVEVLAKDRVECFNVGQGYIYFQTNSSAPQLICMRTDGSERTVVAEGVFTEINLTSRYAYFRDYFEEDTLYHSPLGAGYAEYFYGAKEAVK